MTATIAPAMARRIELWPIEKLQPYAKNARTLGLKAGWDEKVLAAELRQLEQWS